MMKKVTKYVAEQNERIWTPRGLLITNPIERGLRVVSFYTDNVFHAGTSLLIIMTGFICVVEVKEWMWND